MGNAKDAIIVALATIVMALVITHNKLKKKCNDQITILESENDRFRTERKNEDTLFQVWRDSSHIRIDFKNYLKTKKHGKQ